MLPMKLSFRIEFGLLTPGKDGYFIIISMSEFKQIFFTAIVSNNAHGFRSLKSSIFQPCRAVTRQICQKIELYCREVIKTTKLLPGRVY
jgi:hypothetical protein